MVHKSRQLIMLELIPVMGITQKQFRRGVNRAMAQVLDFQDKAPGSMFGLTSAEKRDARNTPLAEMEPYHLLTALDETIDAVGYSHERPVENAIVEQLKTRLMQSAAFNIELSLLMSDELEQWHCCKSCRRTKHKSEFYKARDGRPGVRPRCKMCICEGQRTRDRRAAAVKKYQQPLTILVDIESKTGAA